MTGTGFKAIRDSLGLSQSQMAGTLGVTIATISRWENGHVAITEPRAMWIFNKLNLEDSR